MKVEYLGRSIFYNVIGQGHPVVLLHGFLEDSSMWKDIVAELKCDSRCVTIDLPGHGKSENLGRMLTMEIIAMAVKHVLDQLFITNATFIVHSMGGYVALALAESYPELFRGLCLMNSTAKGDDEERKINRDKGIRLVKKDKDVYIRAAIPNLYALENREKYKNQINIQRESAANMSRESITSAMRGMKKRTDRSNVLKHLNCKRLIILGSKDEILPLQNQLNYLKEIDAKIEILEGGHVPHIENKTEITYIIKHFIEKL